MANEYKRKNYFIKKGFQGKYIFQFYALITLGALLFTIFFALNTAKSLTIIYDNYDVGIGSTPMILFKELVLANWFLIIPIGFVVAILALFHTHRIAGPLYKFEQVLEDMSKGILDPNCKLREKDDAQEVMEQLRMTNQFYADKITDMRAIAGKLDKIDSDNPALKDEVAHLQTILDGFTIK